VFPADRGDCLRAFYFARRLAGRSEETGPFPPLRDYPRIRANGYEQLARRIDVRAGRERCI